MRLAVNLENLIDRHQLTTPLDMSPEECSRKFDALVRYIADGHNRIMFGGSASASTRYKSQVDDRLFVRFHQPLQYLTARGVWSAGRYMYLASRVPGYTVYDPETGRVVDALCVRVSEEDGDSELNGAWAWINAKARRERSSFIDRG